ncbi:MAG TPA: hypothetical protein VI757_10235 [Bacteroidia bacterium]|nr:hypothetical protein [Bacteroidia bacterium]
MKRRYSLTAFDRQGSMNHRSVFSASGPQMFLQALDDSGVLEEPEAKHTLHERIEIYLLPEQPMPELCGSEAEVLGKLSHPRVVAELFEKGITLAELRVIRWLLTGETVKKLAEKYNKSPHTIASQRKCIMSNEVNTFLSWRISFPENFFRNQNDHNSNDDSRQRHSHVFGSVIKIILRTDKKKCKLRT